MPMTKERLINLMKHIQQRNNFTSAKFSSLLNISKDTYDNAIYKNSLNGDNMILCINRIVELKREGQIDFDSDEKSMLNTIYAYEVKE